MFARHFIDSLDFARNGKELHDEVPIAGMPRLQDLVAAPDGQVSFALRGYQDQDGKPMLELALDGMCQLRCQRCLQSMEYMVKQVSRLLLTQEGRPDESPIEVDEVDSIPADSHLDVSALVEEEILLGLPIAPKHEFGACAAAAEDMVRQQKNPFAVLQGLKHK